MDSKVKHKIDNLIQNGYDFNFGDYFKEGFRIFNEFPIGFALFFFLYMMLVMFVSTLPGIGDILNILISTPLIAGMYLVAHKIQKQEAYEFNDFFKGFQYFGTLVTTNVFYNLMIILSAMPFLLAIGEFVETIPEDLSPDDLEQIMLLWEAFPKWTLMLLLPVVYLTVSYLFAYLFVIFYDVSAWDSMEASRKIVTKNWFILFVFMVGLALLAGMGLLLFLIGFFVTFAVATLTIYAAFSSITGLLEEEEEDLVDHLLDES